MKPRDLAIRTAERLARYRKVAKETATFAQMHYVVQRRRLFAELGIDLVIDVGANTGQYGGGLRSFYGGDILSFEPVSTAYETLAARSAGDPRWKACRLALGPATEERTIHVARKTVFSSFLPANEYSHRKFAGISEKAAEERVSVRRLDEVLPEQVPGWRTRRIFLKMDTQGFDLEVFRGAGGILDSVQALQSEVSLIPIYQDMPHWTDNVRAYEQGGFQVAGLFPVSFDGASVIEFDCLMVRRTNAAPRSSNPGHDHPTGKAPAP